MCVCSDLISWCDRQMMETDKMVHCSCTIKATIFTDKLLPTEWKSISFLITFCWVKLETRKSNANNSRDNEYVTHICEIEKLWKVLIPNQRHVISLKNKQEINTFVWFLSFFRLMKIIFKQFLHWKGLTLSMFAMGRTPVTGYFVFMDFMWINGVSII